MKKLQFAGFVAMLYFSAVSLCAAGDNSFLYIKPGEKPPRHLPVDENIKCVRCHPVKIKDIDGYTSATMTLKQSKTGAMSKSDIQKKTWGAYSSK